MPITAAQATALEADWVLTSYHEAGHAVVASMLGLPVYSVWLSHERRFLRWAVVGRTLVAPPGQTIEVDDTPNLLFTTAGITAEAMWLGCRDNLTHDQALAAAEANRINQTGDLREIAACLEGARLTYTQAQDWMHEELYHAWDTVTAVAEALTATGHITGHQLARLT